MFFKKSKQEADILPPPPPFPKLEEPIDKELETKEKIKLKPKKERVNIDKEMKQLEKEILKAKLAEEKPKPKKKPSFRLFKQKEKLSKIHKLEEEKLPPPAIEEPKDEVIAIKHKIHDARNALMDFDLVKAKTIYIKIMRMYPDLSQEKQANVYEDITDLYNERKNAESLNIKS